MAGMGQAWEFVPAGQKSKDANDFSATYRNNLSPLLSSIRLLTTTPRWLYKNGPRYAKYLPKAVADHVGWAKEVDQHMSVLLERARADIRAGKKKDNIFLNAMVAASDELSQTSGGGLSEAEIMANMYDYNFAGHSTTSHTLNFCLHILAVEPEWQDWIREEVDCLYSETPIDYSNLDYEQYYPKLKRCLATMACNLPSHLRTGIQAS